ncbi:MAG TPA: PilN domain-containing protein [Vicinamibacterales bacterium]|jgi:type IV pilus assembly protein PilN
MIRINLLAVERASKKTRVVIPAAQRVTIGAALILISTLLVIGWWFWSLRTESATLDADIAGAELQTQQLRGVLAQMQKFQSRNAQMQQRVTLIEKLRRGQNEPVHVLDELSRALPDRLWLVTMSEQGPNFTIEGRTTSLTAISDFVTNLEGSSWFKKPVEIIDSAVDQTPQGDMVRFTIKAVSNDPEAPVAPAVPAGRGAPPAR